MMMIVIVMMWRRCDDDDEVWRCFGVHFFPAQTCFCADKPLCRACTKILGASIPKLLFHHHNTAAYIILIQNSCIGQASVLCLHQNIYQVPVLPRYYFFFTYPAPYQPNVLCWYRSTQWCYIVFSKYNFYPLQTMKWKKWIFILQRNDHMTQKWDSERNVDKSCQGWSCWGRGLWNFLSPLKSSAHPERVFSVHICFLLC